MTFGAQNRAALNKGTYGTPLPPNAQTRVTPVWQNALLIATTTSNFVVPANVYQMGVAVVGGGGNGRTVSLETAGGGGGGGFAYGVLDVVPGQLLPTITVGAAAGTSSFGSILSATGGASASTGTGGAGGVG